MAAARMSRVAVVTDSTSYLPPELIERHAIPVVPLYVVFGGDRTVPETEITDYDAFFEELRSAEKLPTTSQPSVGDFTAVYEPLLADGARDRVGAHLRRAVGHARGRAPGQGGARARRQRRRAHRGGRLHHGGRRARLHGAGRGQGGRARAGARARRPRCVAEARAELKLWFAIDTLEFLRRGGRIGAASAWIGSTLKVKPILTVENEMTPVERVRTSRAGLRADGRLRAPAPRLGRRRLVGAAHPRARPVRRADRALHARCSATSRPS